MGVGCLYLSHSVSFSLYFLSVSLCLSHPSSLSLSLSSILPLSVSLILPLSFSLILPLSHPPSLCLSHPSSLSLSLSSSLSLSLSSSLSLSLSSSLSLSLSSSLSLSLSSSLSLSLSSILPLSFSLILPLSQPPSVFLSPPPSLPLLPLLLLLLCFRIVCPFSFRVFLCCIVSLDVYLPSSVPVSLVSQSILTVPLHLSLRCMSFFLSLFAVPKGVWFNSHTKSWTCTTAGPKRQLLVFSSNRFGFAEARRMAISARLSSLKLEGLPVPHCPLLYEPPGGMGAPGGPGGTGGEAGPGHGGPQGGAPGGPPDGWGGYSPHDGADDGYGGALAGGPASRRRRRQREAAVSQFVSCRQRREEEDGIDPWDAFRSGVPFVAEAVSPWLLAFSYLWQFRVSSLFLCLLSPSSGLSAVSASSVVVLSLSVHLSVSLCLSLQCSSIGCLCYFCRCSLCLSVSLCVSLQCSSSLMRCFSSAGLSLRLGILLLVVIRGPSPSSPMRL